MAAATVVLGVLLVAVLAVTARFAADVDPVERTLACGVLAVEALISALAVVLGLLGNHSLPFALTAATFPVLVLAIVKCWPHREAEGPQVGYNDGHG
jgi:heme A synthase